MRLVNFLFTLLIAVTVSVSARTVGALIVSSMMVVPVACAMQFGRNYRQTILWAVGLDMIFMTTGLFAAYYLGLKPRGHRSVRRRLPDTGIYSQKIIKDIFEMI